MRSTRSRRPTSSSRSTPTSCAPAPPASSTRARSRRAAASRATRAQQNRLYAVESDPTNTGTKADHRLPLRASEIEGFARAVGQQLGVAGAGPGTVPEAAAAWMAPLVSDLQAARGRSLVIAGDGQPRERARARARDQRRARQRRRDGRLHADRRSAADEPAGRPARAGRRDERRHGRLPADPGRQPGLHRARRPELRAVDAEGRRCARISASTRTRPPRSASGTSPRRISSRCGATSAPTTGPSRSSSR